MGQCLRRYRAAVLSLAVVGASPAWATDRTWNLAGNGSWGSNSSWSPSGIPGASDTAIFNSSGSHTINLGGATRSVDTLKYTGSGSNHFFTNGSLSLNRIRNEIMFATANIAVPIIGAGPTLSIELPNSSSASLSTITATNVTVTGGQTSLVDINGTNNISGTLTLTGSVLATATGLTGGGGDVVIDFDTQLQLSGSGTVANSLGGSGSVSFGAGSVSFGALNLNNGELMLFGGNSGTFQTANFAGTVSFSPSTGTVATFNTVSGGTANLTAAGFGELRLGDGVTNPLHTLNALTLQAGKVVCASGTIRTATISATNGKLDLRSNHLIVTGGAIGSWTGSAYTDVTGLIAKGRNGGNWSGNGITTSMIDATAGTGYTALGVARASEVRGIAAGATDTWAGQTVTGSDTLVMYTYGGDTNLSGNVDVDDYGQIDFNASVGGILTGWYNGDFDYNGVVDVDDYGIIDFVINIQGAPFSTGSGIAVSTVPEPSAITVVGLLGALVLRRHRRGAHAPTNTA